PAAGSRSRTRPRATCLPACSRRLRGEARCSRGSSAAAFLAVLAVGGGAAPSPTVGGCPVFPASNPWNQRVDKLPVAPSSAGIIRSIGIDAPVHADFGSGLWEGSPIG